MQIKYLKHIELPYYEENFAWSICPYTGSLLKDKIVKTKHQVNIPLKVSRALQFCDQPYSCKVNNEITTSSSNLNLIQELNKMHHRLFTISNNRFYMTRLYSSIKYPLFDNTVEAIAYINSLPLQIKLKYRLCLQRAFLTSKVSKSFIDDGVIFIGASLPTGNMHAWVIENGKQPDYDDYNWINYRPLLAFYH